MLTRITPNMDIFHAVLPPVDGNDKRRKTHTHTHICSEVMWQCSRENTQGTYFLCTIVGSKATELQ